jgi:hypothetical protein
MTEGPVPHIFDGETLRARLRDHNVVVFQITSGLVQSGVLALAAVVLIDIFYADRDQAVLFSLWLGAFMFAVLAFQRQLYLPVATPRGGVSDVWPLMLLGLAQFVSFACLSPRANGVAPWGIWYFSSTASAIMGLAAVSQALRFATLDDYAPDVKEVGRQFARWLKRDVVELVIVVAVSVLLCVIVASQALSEAVLEWLSIGVAWVMIVGNAWLVRRDGQRFRELYANVYAMPSPTKASSEPPPA